jgi:FixJ family two-component response regulator
MQTKPPHILLIDDDLDVLDMVGEALTHFGIKVHPFSEGHRALRLLEDPDSPQFDLVVTDINMVGVDGFDVINRVKSCRPSLPVILMTGQATLDFAIRAMRMGASNLFQKPIAIRELVNSVFHLVDLHRELSRTAVGLRGLVEEKRHFLFQARELDIPSMVGYMTDRLVPMGLARPTNVDVIGMAFHEALVNALEHGCLELDSKLKGDLFAEQDPFQTLLQARLADPHYATRAIDVRLHVTPQRFEAVITDGGPGFDTSQVSRFMDASLSQQCGRGLAMIRLVMDEVSHNAEGNQIRLVLNRK